ncbi:hypothetical protein Y1Q_0013490 [Alligator mississippiensis]|uniref:Uncharacterized protein n=1 Tax=Alligator mississippiensis TaxID=8496 RepID=A0A151P2X7_ALLMI|nr:hypothetical protein Y1Q_0013490 [Alligator mississippiensis]
MLTSSCRAGIDSRYRTGNKGIQTLDYLEEEAAKICARGLSSGFTHSFRSFINALNCMDASMEPRMLTFCHDEK